MQWLYGVIICRNVLKAVWNCPPRMHFSYKRNSNAVFSIATKREEEHEKQMKDARNAKENHRNENRFAGFEE